MTDFIPDEQYSESPLEKEDWLLPEFLKEIIKYWKKIWKQ